MFILNSITITKQQRNNEKIKHLSKNFTDKYQLLILNVLDID